MEFDDKDFEPTWFEPAQGIEAINGLLEHGRVGRHRLPEHVLRELELLGRTLADVRRRSCQFYLVEVSPGEDLHFAGPELDRGQGYHGLVVRPPTPLNRRVTVDRPDS